MHGVARVRTTEEERLKKQKERAVKLQLYRTCVDKIFLKRSKKEFDDEALKLTADLLCGNPDFSTIWNFRREILLVFEDKEDGVRMEELYDAELRLTETCLKVNPKSYYAWFQRIWVLERKSSTDWRIELSLCNQYLRFDERNFHCWDYRNYVVNKANTDLKEEFKFTLSKIHENFSNYSAWHYRSKLLKNLFPDTSEVNSIEESKQRDELELVLNAAFTDPNDTSAWFYQRWLLGATNRDVRLAVSRISKDVSCIAFNQNISLTKSNYRVKIQVNQKEVLGKWISLSGLHYDVIWILHHHSNIDFTKGDVIEVILKSSPEKNEETVVCESIGQDFVGYSPVSFCNNFGKSVIDELKDQQKSCEQLLELEPDSKWTLLTLAVILNSIDHISNYKKCDEIFEKLKKYDVMRINYYKDLRSRWHIEYFLENDFNLLKQGIFLLKDQTQHCIELTALYHLQYWSACKHVNARSFKLTSQSLPSFRVLLNCEVLDIGNNLLNSLEGFPELLELKTLYLDGNNINEKDLKYLKKCRKLENVYLFDSSSPIPKSRLIFE